MEILLEKQPLLNNAIKAQKVLLLDKDGERVGEMSCFEALSRAKNEDLDLMQVGESPNFAICKIVNYDSWKYHEDKKKQKQDFQNRSQEMKTMNFRPATGEHDFLLKIKKIQEFLEDNHKVKVCLKLKSREGSMRDVNNEVIQKIQSSLEEVGIVDGKINWSFKEINFIMKPNKKPVLKVKM